MIGLQQILSIFFFGVFVGALFLIAAMAWAESKAQAEAKYESAELGSGC